MYINIFILKNARIPQLRQVGDELQVGYTIMLLTFKWLFFHNNYYER